MQVEVWTYVGLAAAAFGAGILNSVAGGGTLLTFPALFPSVLQTATLANGTSTIALLPGSLAGAWGYRTEMRECWRFARFLLLPSLIGGWLGAWLACQDEQQFKTLVPWLILTAAVLFLIQPIVSAWVKHHRPDHTPGPLGLTGILAFQFLVAVYGGYFGAGIGIVMLATLGVMGVGDIHRMNAVKTFLATAINTTSVIEFARRGLVQWEIAGVMAIAAIAGGYAGARVARRLPAARVRWAVVVIAFGLAVYYFARR